MDAKYQDVLVPSSIGPGALRIPVYCLGEGGEGVRMNNKHPSLVARFIHI